MPTKTPTPEPLPSREAAAIASLIFAVGAMLSYAGQRVYEHSRGGLVDPTPILMSAPAAYPCPALVATCVVGLCSDRVGRAAGRWRRAPGERLARHGMLAAAWPRCCSPLSRCLP